MNGNSQHWFLFACLLLTGWLFWLLSPVITPFAVAAGLAYLGDPLVDRLERLHFIRWPVSRTAAVVIVFVMMLLTVSLVVLILLPLVIDQVGQLIRKIPVYSDWLANTAWPWVQSRLGLPELGLDLQTASQALSDYWKEVSAALLSVAGTVTRGGQAVLHWVMNLVLIPVVTFYLLRDWDALVEGIRTLVPRAMEPTVSGIFREVNEVLGAFIRGQMLVMLALGLIYAIGLWAVGLDLGFIIGLGAGLLSIVPYLGTFLGVIAAVIAALFEFRDVLHVVLVLGVFAIGQSLESMVLTPKLVGDRIGLHPVTVIFAVLAGGQLFGFLGILLALPVAAALNVLVRHLHDRYRSSVLYGADERPVVAAKETADGAEAGDD